ncbi:MAG TPA: hypothetical protein PLD25_06890 [Chloroflexota bacterium]|nr:hypothetical protein [Chloroflexota bacterium]
MERELISTRFGLFQWSDDGNGLYILDGAANTAGNNISHQLAGLQYADFYYIDLTQAGYPEQKLAGDIPIYLPNVGAWAYSPEARAMAGTFGIEGQGPVFSLLFLP